MTSDQTKSNRLSSRLETRQPVRSSIKIPSNSDDGYAPNDAAEIGEIWNEYSVRMKELVNIAISYTKKSQGRHIFEEAIFLYNAAIENHYSRIGRQNPNKIELALINQLSAAELIMTHMRLCSVVDFLFKSLLAETNYRETGIISQNTVYFATEVTHGRRSIIEQSHS